MVRIISNQLHKLMAKMIYQGGAVDVHEGSAREVSNLANYRVTPDLVICARTSKPTFPSMQSTFVKGIITACYLKAILKTVTREQTSVAVLSNKLGAFTIQYNWVRDLTGLFTSYCILLRHSHTRCPFSILFLEISFCQHGSKIELCSIKLRCKLFLLTVVRSGGRERAWGGGPSHHIDHIPFIYFLCSLMTNKSFCALMQVPTSKGK